VLIVARLRRKGNEEKFFLWPAGALDFRESKQGSIFWLGIFQPVSRK
jgi:hypothetical protein